MTSVFRRILLGIMVAAVAIGTLSCGSVGTNNDQGTSFLAMGFYDDASGNVGRTALVLPFFTDLPVFTTDFGTQVEGLMGWVFLGLQNRLSCQFLRLEKVVCDYEIPFSGLIVPTDTHLFSFVIAPTGPCGTEGETDALTGESGNFLYAGIEILSPDIWTYLTVNQNLLPELPFRMNVTCRATGVSQAGDVFTTNDATILVQFTDTAECCGGTGTTPGFQQGSGTGGTFDSFGDEDPEADLGEASAAGAVGGGSIESSDTGSGDSQDFVAEVADDDFVIE